jgi:patatin-related protein
MTHADVEDEQELRLAIVMTGGVSLAVWMGGVALEIDHVRRHAGVYKELIDLMQISPKIDIISGTSAGGLNGALLAAGIAFNHPLDLLRTVWLRDGSLANLIRKPTSNDLRSVLDGDGYFLARLRDTFDEIRGPSGGVVSTESLTLVMTTALLKAHGQTFTDRYGNQIPEVQHRGLFRFELADFREEEIVKRLALAARTSAAHPGGFEASYIPAAPGDVSAERPDMASVIDWKGSRFAVDGGVLMNRPLKPALETIYSRAAEGEVRRVILFVVPDPGHPADHDPDKPDAAPSLAGTVTSALRLPQVQSIADELAELERRYGALIRQRDIRRALMAQTDALTAAAESQYVLYRIAEGDRVATSVLEAMRPAIQRAVAGQVTDLARLTRFKNAVAETFSNTFPPAIPTAGTSLEEQWPWGTRVLRRSVEAILDLLRQGIQLTPLGGDSPERRGLAVLRRLCFDVQHHIEIVREQQELFWRTADSTLPEEGTERNWLLTELQRLPPFLRAQDHEKTPPWRGDTPPPADPRVEVATLCGAIMAAAAPVLIRVAYTTLANVARGVEHPSATSLLEAVFGLANVPRENRPSKLATTDTAAWSVQNNRGFLTHAVGFPMTSSLRLEHVRTAEWFLRDLEWLEPMSTDERLETAFGLELDFWVARLLQLEIAHGSAAADARLGQEVEFVQVSAQTDNPFDSRDDPEEKLTGLQLAHFGAFYKTSWRANDWMWGRLDAAAYLVRVLLDPRRLQRIGLTSGEAFTRISAIALAAEHAGPERDYLVADQSRWEQLVKRELAALDGPTSDLPFAFPVTSAWIAQRIQVAVLIDELPWVMRAMADDIASGGADRDDARRFFTRYFGFSGDSKTMKSLSRRLNRELVPDDGRVHPVHERLKPNDAVDLFRLCRVGQERIDGELGTDLFSTTATAAFATAIGAGASETSGLGPVRGLLKTLKGAARATARLTRSTVRASKTAAALVVALVVAAVAILAGGVTELVHSPTAVDGIAVVVLAAALLTSSIRRWWWLPGVMLLLGTLLSLLLVLFANPSAEAVWAIVLVVIAALFLVALLAAGGRLVTGRGAL